MASCIINFFSCTPEYTFGLVRPANGSKAQYLSSTYETKKGKHRGCALIINMIQCCCDNSNNNSSSDGKDMESLFNYLGYDVLIRDVKKMQDIYGVFKRDILLEDHSEYDSFVCCILPYKCEVHHQRHHDRTPWINDCFPYDGEPFEATGITELLSGVGCPKLKGKPKIFFVQASRGIQEEAEPGDTLAAVPDIADFAFCYQTPEKYPAYGSPSGTTFIQEICRAFTQYAKFVPFMDIMVHVHKIVKDKAGEKEPCTSPETTSNLRKNFYFF